MTTSDIKPGEGVKDVHVTEDTLSVDLIDGRTITVPLVWYPKLLQRLTNTTDILHEIILQ